MSAVYAVLVLYKTAAEDSPAWQSLQALADMGELPGGMQVLVYDNSPVPQSLPPSAMQAEYLSDTANSGLAAAYNTALAKAMQCGCRWLLLLDQDTVLTAEYWAELTSTLRGEVPDNIVAVLAHLAEAGHVHSPTGLPRLSHVPVLQSGLLTLPVTAFNSGAVLRVTALQRMGGFNTDFPLEFSDHVTFARLQRDGGQILLLRSTLTHSLSTDQRADTVSATRYLAMLQAERRFYLQFGSVPDHAWYRLRKLKQAVGRALQPGGAAFALLELQAGFGLLKPR